MHDSGDSIDQGLSRKGMRLMTRRWLRGVACQMAGPIIGLIVGSLALGATSSGNDSVVDLSELNREAAVLESVLPDLDAALAALEGRTIRYSWMLFHPRDGEAPTFEPPEDATSIDRLAKLTLVEVYRCSSSYRIREQTVWSSDSREIGRIADYSSDSIEFHTRYAGASGEHSHLMLDLNDRMHRVGPAMDAYGWRVLGQVAPLDFQFIVRSGIASETLERIDRDDDGLEWFKWQWVPDAPQTGFTLGIDLDSRRLRRIAMDLHSTDLSLAASQLMLRKDVTFTEHLVDGELLRGAKIVDQIGEAGAEYPPVWAVSVVVPLAVAAMPRTSELVHLVARPNESVQDTRFDIAYQGGDVRLNLDGRIVQLATPPRGDIGWELDQWVTAVPEPARDSSGRPPQVTAVAASNTPEVFYAGTVLVEDPPVSVSHKFSLTNNTDEPWQVLQIVKSCGCLQCEVDRDIILPGDSAVVSLAIKVPASGRHSHSATVVLKDKSFVTYHLAADGYTEGTLRALSSGFMLDGDVWRAEIRAYWVESESSLVGGELDALPELAIDGHPEATLTFAGWSLIEEADLMSKRPRRLFGRAVVEIPCSEVRGGAGMSTTLRLIVAPDRVAEIPVLRFSGGVTR